jgi:tetratricopeptide (TPR) repeat protein
VHHIGLKLTNLGKDLAEVEIIQGLWGPRRASLYPGQEVNLLLSARAWPPVVRGIYPVKLRLRRGDKVAARLKWDPLLLGRQALETGDFSQAASILQELVDQGMGGFDAYAMLAEAWARLGEYPKASWSLAALSGLGRESIRDYQALAMGPIAAPGWDTLFSHLTGYHPGLLRRSCSLSYEVKGPPCLSEGEEVSLKGTGYHGTYLRRADQPGGHLKLWLTDQFPAVPLFARLHLRLKDSPPPDQQQVKVEILSHQPTGSRLLASREVFGRDLPGRAGTISLPFVNQQANNGLEVRISFFSPLDVRLDRLTVGVDIKAHMRHILRWYFDAWGRVSLHTRRYAAAVESFENLLSLDPHFSEAYLPFAQALVDTGKVERAYALAQRAEEIFQAWPARLKEVRDIYQTLQKPGDMARVDKRLAYLHPSLKKEVQFAAGMTLLGYDLPQSQVNRGGMLNINYYWQCWARPPLNYFIFVHLRGPDKTLTFDHLLDHGQKHMNSLFVGQVVREDYRLQIPANLTPGKYKLVVGIWDPWFTRKGLPIIRGENEGNEELTLATVEVR